MPQTYGALCALAEQHGVAMTEQVRSLMRAVEKVALRAQADARPVAYQRRMRAYEREEWSDWHDVHEGVALDCEKTPTLNGWVYEIRRLYTHPETSAPGLSEEVREWIKTALSYLGMTVYPLGLKATGEDLLTRASAATVGEASAAPKLHVGESSFEDWYQDYAARLTGNPKQTARDAYAAGMGDPLVVPCDAVRHAGTPHKFEISEEWLSKRLAIADDADCAAGQSAPKRPCDAPPGCNGNNCLGCGEQQAEPGADEQAASEAYDKVDRFLRNNLDDVDYVEYSEALDCVLAAQSGQRAGVPIEAVAKAYGYLWHVNEMNADFARIYPPAKAAYAARKVLREFLTHEQRGEAINEAGREIGRYVDESDRAAAPTQQQEGGS